MVIYFTFAITDGLCPSDHVFVRAMVATTGTYETLAKRASISGIILEDAFIIGEMGILGFRHYLASPSPNKISGLENTELAVWFICKTIGEQGITTTIQKKDDQIAPYLYFYLNTYITST